MPNDSSRGHGADNSPLERHLRVHRTARFYQIGRSSPAVSALWIVCHGYGQLAANFATACLPLADESRVVVAPEGLSRFYLGDPGSRHGPDSPIGASWMTREDRGREITDYVEYLDHVVGTVLRELGRDVPIVAMGFSQGVATAARWTALGSARITRLILWGGSIPNDLPVEDGKPLFRGASVVLVAGRTDRLMPPATLEREQESLRSRGVASEIHFHDGGHTLNSVLLRRLADQ